MECWPVYLVCGFIFVIYAFRLTKPNEGFTVTPETIGDVVFRPESHDSVLSESERILALQKKLISVDRKTSVLSLAEMEKIIQQHLGDAAYKIVYIGESKESCCFDMIIQRPDYYLAIYLSVPKETWKPTIKGYLQLVDFLFLYSFYF